MYILVGNKQNFAVEMAIGPDKWRNKMALWLNNTRIGDWEDENITFPFLNSLQRIATAFEDLWDDELAGLDCRQLFFTVIPCYFDPNSFYDLPPEEQDRLIKFDKFLFHWGENFDSWTLTAVYKHRICKFLWVHTPLRGDDAFEVKNNILCHDVKIEEILGFLKNCRCIALGHDQRKIKYFNALAAITHHEIYPLVEQEI